MRGVLGAGSERVYKFDEVRHLSAEIVSFDSNVTTHSVFMATTVTHGILYYSAMLSAFIIVICSRFLATYPIFGKVLRCIMIQ